MTTNLEAMKHRYRTVPKVFFARVYQNQIQSSKRRGQPLPEYTYADLIEWLKLQPNLTQLWEDFQKSGHDRCHAPSIDRLDDSLPYTLTNIRLVTWNENMMKAKKDTREGKLNDKYNRARPVVQYDLATRTEIARFPSLSAAAESVGKYHASIGACCNGRQQSAYGFYWSFAQ